MTRQSSPANAKHGRAARWSPKADGSDSTVGRIWRAKRLKPHRVDSFKATNDPEFVNKLEVIVGLYLNSSDHVLESIGGRKDSDTSLGPHTAWSALEGALAQP